MEIIYPKEISEFEIHAELFWKLKMLQYDVRGEVPIYKQREKWIDGKRKYKDRKTYRRPDLVIFKNKKPIIAIEVKRKGNKNGLKKQIRTAEMLCENVLSCVGKEEINNMKIQQRYNVIDTCPNGHVGEKIAVSIKLSEYFADMDQFGLSEDEKNKIRTVQLECLKKIVGVFDKKYKFSKLD